MKKIKYVIALVVMIMGASASAELIIQDPLEHGFLTPPDSAKPWIFHCWMNGYVTKEGITKEFEEMKKAGVGGMQIFNVRTGFPRGPVSFNSPEWFELYAHAVKEAGRLGLELIFHNTGGFSGSGGPWVPVEDSMQMLVGSETRVRGPVKFSGKLPMPPVTQRSVEMGNFRGALEPFYRDIAVLAIKAPEGNVTTMLASSPVITASDPQFDFVKIIDGDPQTGAALPKPELGAYQYIQFEFPQPFSAQALTILAMPGQQSYAGELMVSDDGKTFKSVTKFSMESPAINPPILASSFRPVEGKFYRIIFTPGRAKVSKIEFGEIELQQGVRIPNWAEKSGFFRTTGMSGLAADTTWNVDAAQAVRLSGILDLTTAMKTDGSLAWDIPAGNWIILRLGHTSKGELSHPAPFGGEGLEVDKFSKEALDRCWAGHSAKLIAASGPLVGKALTGLHTDSYENGCQNWTPQFREEFKKRRGYDPLPYLPAMLGFPVESADISERFLWDLRRTYADLFADNFYGHLKTLAKQSGVQLSAQSFGIGNLDNLQAGGRIDIPQSEFWISNPVETSIIGKMASSIAHTTGKRLVGAEAFTSTGKEGQWLNHPYSLKTHGDLNGFCSGVNRFIFHAGTHQPWTNRAPGMTYGRCGVHFDWTETWWQQAGPWMTYLSRCQWLLQEGRFVADVCYFIGEGAPNSLSSRRTLRPVLPAGYDYDGISAETLLKQMSVKDGYLVLPTGMNYRYLVLPDRTLTPALLKKVRELVAAGATIIGAKPLTSPSLVGYPQCDEEVRNIANEIWGTGNEKSGTHPYGNGRVIWGKTFEEIFSDAQLLPDFAWSGDAKLNYIHRRSGETDYYFVANSEERPVEAKAVFRVSGRQPELWYPDTGRIEPCSVYNERDDGQIEVPLRFDPAGSVFVVFRQKRAGDHIIDVKTVRTTTTQPLSFKIASATSGYDFITTEPGSFTLTAASGKKTSISFESVPAPVVLAGPWDVSFAPGWGAPEHTVFDKLISWPEHSDLGIKYFSGTAVYKKTFSIPADYISKDRKLFLDLGDVQVIADVTLNGKNLGIFWKPPFRADISGIMKSGENTLEVKVVNLWPNRLIGDEQFPDDCKFEPAGNIKQWPTWLTNGLPRPEPRRLTFTTWKHWKKDDKLLPSGLIGPVTIQATEVKKIEL